MRRGQAFASSLQLLAYVRVKTWNEKKGFGIGRLVDETGKGQDGDEQTVLVHPANFVKNPKGRPATSVRLGSVVQGDVGEKNGKPVLENITKRDGSPIGTDAAYIGSRLNESLMTKNLLSREGATAPEGARLDQTDYLLKTVVAAMHRIDEDLTVCRNAHKKTIQLLAHMAERQGVKKLVVGEEYLAQKNKIWGKRTDYHKAKKAASKSAGNSSEHDSEEKDDDDHEVAKTPAGEDKKDSMLEVDDLLEETKAETSTKKGKKSKK